MRAVLPGWPWLGRRQQILKTEPDRLLLNANDNLRALLEDNKIPAAIRAAMQSEFDAIDALSQKLNREEIHIAAFGRVSVGKSSLLNALLGEPRFSTSPLHGETTEAGREAFIVLNHNLQDADLDNRFESALADLAIKFSYTFRF